MDSMITMDDARERASIDDYSWIVGKFLVCYGDSADDAFTATVRLIEGCRHKIHEVSDILREQFPKSSSVMVRDEEYLDEMHIDLEWSEMEYEWDDHDAEFEERVISTLEILSRE